MSPLLFDIYLEPLCQSINKCVGVQVYKFCDAEVRILAYADDLVIFVSNKKSATRVMELVESYRGVSGAIINKEKCVGVWAGMWGTSPERFEDITWQTRLLKYLKGAPRI